MSEDLRDKITQAIDRAEQVARAAQAPNGWFAERIEGDPFDSWEVGTMVPYGEDGGTSLYDTVADVSAQSEAEHIALNDPAAVLRRSAADRRVLERHHPVDMDPDPPLCGMCSYWAGGEEDGEWVLEAPWPCPDIEDLADRWGVDA